MNGLLPTPALEKSVGLDANLCTPYCLLFTLKFVFKNWVGLVGNPNTPYSDEIKDTLAIFQYDKNKLVPLIVETNDIDVTYNEAVLKGDKSIGYITSGGFAHFVNKSVAFSYINQNEIKSDKGIQVEINGDFFNCSIIKEPLYDPTGQKMRS